MYLMIFLTAAVIAMTAFSQAETPIAIHPFYGFYIHAAGYLIKRPLLSISGFLLLTLALTMILKSDESGIKGKLTRALSWTIASSITGFLMSPIIIFAIALVELNLMAMIINIGPGYIGIRTDTPRIIEGLDKNTNAPEIINFGEKGSERVRAVAVASSGKESYYSSSVLPAIPGLMIMPTKNTGSNLWLVDDVLLMDPTNENYLPAISPVLGYKIVQQTFPERKIKLLPKIIMLPKTDYKTMRMEDIQRKYKELEQELEDYNQQAAQMDNVILQDEKTASESAENLNAIYRGREAAYQKCLADYKSEIVCKEVIGEWEEKVKSSILDNNKALKQAEDDLQLKRDYQDYLKVIEAERSVFKVMESNVDNEYGQFVPPDTIYLTREAVAVWNTADYLETLVHEYLHYASFISDKRVLNDAFFEEGLTEYFARKAIDKTIGEKTNIGYPATVAIIRQMAKRIDDSELAEIYFGKDQAMLEETLDRVYGDNFYRNNRIFFTLMQYTNDQEQLLKYVNTVMARIGGSPLSIPDITSSTLK